MINNFTDDYILPYIYKKVIKNDIIIKRISNI